MLNKYYSIIVYYNIKQRNINRCTINSIVLVFNK